MRSTLKGLCWMLIMAHVLTEFYLLVYRLNPESATQMIRPFYGAPDTEISFLWYIKDCCDQILIVTVFFVMAMIAKQYSTKLFLVACIFCFYWVVDTVMYFYDYKRTYWLYIVLLSLDVTAAAVTLLWKEKKKALVKSLQ